MRLASRICLICCLLAATAHRLPAPIQEEASPSPTATPQASAPPAPTATAPLSKREAAQFAGTWTGKIKFGRFGDMDFTLMINSEATSLIQKSKMFGERAHPTNVTAGKLSWDAGEKEDHAWTLTPNPDGQSALVTLKLPSGAQSIATFQRTESPWKRGRDGARTKSNQ